MLKLDKPQPEAVRPVRDSRCPRRHGRHWALCALLATTTFAIARSDDGPAVKVSRYFIRFNNTRRPIERTGLARCARNQTYTAGSKTGATDTV